MDLNGNLKVIKIEKSENLESVYLENPDDKSKIICVYICCHSGEEYFSWTTKWNLEFAKREEAVKHADNYYYKGCEIHTHFERDTWELTLIITGNLDLDIKNREIDAGSVGYEKEGALTEALDLIDEAISEKEQQAKAEKLLYENGNAYYYGEGVEIDYKKAFEIFKDLSDNKQHLGAMEFLCYMYYYGKGTEVNYELARKYCENIENKIRNCNSNILYLLGEMYFEGLGVEIDYPKAKSYFEKALSKDSKDADDIYYKLGLLNSGNYGIEKNEEDSNTYFNKIERDLLLSIIYLLLAIRPAEEQNLAGIYKCIGCSRNKYSDILNTNIPFDHLAQIYYKKVNYLQDNEYDYIMKRLKEKLELYLKKETNIESKTFSFENENDIHIYVDSIVNINK